MLTEDGSELMIAEDSTLKPAFMNTGRYSLGFSIEGEEATSTLSYTGD